MIIRKAEIKDSEKIAQAIISGYNIKTLEEGEEIFIDELKKDHFIYVAEENGKILGVASWGINGQIKHQLAELYKIVVLPENRGKGVSQELYKKLLEDVNNLYKSKNLKLRKFYLYTHASNSRAIAFYKKMGFAEEARLKDHYYRGEDELVLSINF